jgi:hypothetical protein
MHEMQPTLTGVDGADMLSLRHDTDIKEIKL